MDKQIIPPHSAGDAQDRAVAVNPVEPTESQVRQAARRAGLRAEKSRRAWSVDNFGEYRLVDPELNCVVAGSRYDMSAAEVIAFCREAAP